MRQTGTSACYACSSFTSDWGPGPRIEATFEEECGCDLEFVDVDDSGTLLTRLRLEGERYSPCSSPTRWPRMMQASHRTISTRSCRIPHGERSAVATGPGC